MYGASKWGNDPIKGRSGEGDEVLVDDNEEFLLEDCLESTPRLHPPVSPDPWLEALFLRKLPDLDLIISESTIIIRNYVVSVIVLEFIEILGYHLITVGQGCLTSGSNYPI